MIIIPAQIDSIRSLKDRTYRITFETNELTPEQLTGVGLNLQKFGWLAFKEGGFGEKDKAMMGSMKVDFDDTGKTKGQRLRGVLYRCWEVDQQGYEVFDDYYNYQMEIVINHYKKKLP